MFGEQSSGNFHSGLSQSFWFSFADFCLNVNNKKKKQESQNNLKGKIKKKKKRSKKKKKKNVPLQDMDRMLFDHVLHCM